MALEIPEEAPQEEQEFNPYDRLVDDMKAKRSARAPLSQSMYVADKIKPEHAQQALDLSRRSPFSASQILRDLERGVNPEPGLTQNDYDRLLNESPRVAEWLKNPLNAAAAKNDYQKLQDLERILHERANPPLRVLDDAEITKAAETAAKRRARVASENSRYQPNLSSGTLDEYPPTPPEEFYQAFLDEELETRRGEEQFIGESGKVGFGEALKHRFKKNPFFVVPLFGQVPELADALSIKLASDRYKEGKGSEEDLDLLVRVGRMELAAQRRGTTIMGKVAEIGADLPAFVMELALTGGTGSLARVGVKQAVSGMVKGVARKTAGVIAEVAVQSALSQGIGTVAGAIRRQTPIGEAIVDPDGTFRYEIQNDTGENVLLSLGKEGLSTMLDIASAKIPMGPIYKILSKEAGEVAAKTLTQRLMRVGTEGVKGAFGGIATNELTKLAKAITLVGPAYEIPSGEELAAQGIVFGGMGAGHALLQRRAAATERTIEGQRKIVEEIESPVVAEGVIERITKGTPEEFVYLKPEDVRSFYQGKGLDPRVEMAKVLGSHEKWDQAQEPGHKVQVPTSRYAVTLGLDQEASKFFQGKVTFDPMDASREEIEAAIKEAGGKKGEKKPSKELSADEQVEKSAQQVAKFIQGRMKELGFTREAESFGKLYAERYKARAERRALGEQPGELFDKLGLGIFKREGPTPDAEGQYVKVLEQGARPRIERVPGETPAEVVENAGKAFPDATIEPMTPEEVKSMISDAMGGGERTFMQPAFHGSPHKFDKFSLQKIGTGEGHQAYGWGLYFAGNKEVGKYYKDTLGKYVFEYDGKDLPENSPERLAAELLWGAQGNKKEVISDIKEMYDNSTKEGREVRESTIKAVKAMDFSKVKQGGRLYEVDIPDDTEFIQWDKPISEQPSHVKKAFEKLWPLGFKEYMRLEDAEAKGDSEARKSSWLNPMNRMLRLGGNFYEELVQVLGSPKRASQALAREGVPGIKYFDEVSREKEEGTANYVVFDDKLVNIKRFEQPPAEGEAARGDIEFGADGVDINLFRGADRSTFLHESGHLWMDELITDATTQGVPEQLGKDLNAVLKWLGADVTTESGAKAIRKGLTREQQEKFAAGFEAYLMEGKAPSAELRGVFYRFAEWLKRIYKSLLGLEEQAGQKLDLSPEVRDVMDRLLASDEQIAEAKSTENVQSILAGADWLPPAVREEIGNALNEVDRQAKEELNQKLMAQVRREETAQWARESEKMRAAVAAEVDQRPEQVALANLERGLRPDGSPLGPQDLPAIKLSREATLEALGGDKGALASLPRKIFGKDGVSPEEAANYFGFSSADEMFKTFRSMREYGTPEQRQIQSQLEGLDLQRKLLAEQKQPLEAEAEEATKNLKAGRKTLANRLEKAIRNEERAKIEPIVEILKDIKDRGGIDPVVATEDLPREFKAKKKGTGVASDEIAQELADRGYIDLADSDTLYKKLSEWQSQVKASKERAADAKKEAQQMARERVSASIEALIENSAEQERLRVQLARLQSESAAFKREHQVNQRKRLIDQLTDERMKAQYPDMLTDGSLPEEASKVVYNAQRSKLLARQMELLAEHKLPAMKKIIGTLAKRGGFSDLMRAQAEMQLEKQVGREIVPSLYKREARKAFGDQVKAMQKGDWATLFEAQRRELLNHELYRAAEKVKEAFDSGAEYMAKFNDDKVRAKIGKAGGEHLDLIDDLMERFDFRPVSERTLDRRGKFREWYNAQVKLAEAGEGHMPEIPERLLDESFKKNYQEMTYEEFQDVVDAAKNIEHQARLKNRLLASVDQREFDASIEEGVRGMVANSAGPRKQNLEPRLPDAELKKRGVAGFFAAHRKMASLAREMDGFKDNGPIWDMLIRPANRAGNREATLQAEAADRMDKINGYSPAEQLRMGRREFIPEIGDSLSRWGQIMVALNWGNEGNRQRIRDGYKWTDQQVQAILDRLTEKDWKFVRGVWDLVDAYWPEIRDLNKRVTGLEPEKVEASPFMTKFGEQPGGYFPIKYDPTKSPETMAQEQAEDAKPTLMGASIRATTRHGHREARSKHVERPVRLDPGVISDHVNQVIHDLTHYEFVTDANRILRDKRFQKAFLDHYGDQNYVQMKDWVKDIAVGNQPAKTQVERGLNWFRQGTVISRLALNLKQFITDQSGILQGAQRIGPEWAAKGWAQVAGDAMKMESAYGKVEAKSEFMRNRWRTFNREINESVGKISQKGKLEILADMGLDAATMGKVDVEGIQRTFFMLLAKAQQIQDAPIWIGAYEKAMAEHKVDAERSPADRERTEKLAIDLADQAVLDSFGGGQIKDLAQVQRGSPAWKVFTTFGSFANATLQRNIESFKKYKISNRSLNDRLKLASDIALVNIIPAAIGSTIAYALSNNKKKEEKKLLREFAADQAGQWLNQVTLGREFTPALHDRDYQGPAGTEFFQTGNRFLGSMIDAAWELDASKIDVKAANQAAGTLFHYPAVFVERVANAVMEAKHGPMESFRALLGGRRKM